MQDQDLQCIDDEQEDLFCENYGNNKEDDEFDNIVGTLQDIVIEDLFDEMNQKFMQQYYKVFEESEENKQEYIIIFKEYQKIIENHIEAELEKRIKDFAMKNFLTLLEDRMDQIDEQLLNLLQSFSDFETFKELMLDYKRDVERKSGYMKKEGEIKEAKEEDFFDFKKNKKADDHLGQLEVSVKWLPTPKVTQRKTHQKDQSWKQ